MNRFSSFVQLERYIRTLPSPTAGKKRVFRGQTSDHAVMLPTGLRPKRPIRNEHIWHSYAQMLAVDLTGRNGATLVTEQPEILLGLWYYAMAQHYGPGSNLLDVSKSWEVALWFALHEAVQAETTGVMGPPGPIEVRTDVYRRDEWTQYQDAREGFLYIFDVPQWHGRQLPRHGELIDLRDAPPVFLVSERVKAQAACLIAAEASEGGGDLRGFYACEPLSVAWPMEGCKYIQKPAWDLFPKPARDPWYNRLLHLPMVLRHVRRSQTREPNWYFGHPIPITLYLPQGGMRELLEITSRFKGLNPPLLFPELVRPGLEPSLMTGDDQKLYAQFLGLNVIPILLEAPIFAHTPAPESDEWNQELLFDGLPYDAKVNDFFTGDALEPADLIDVFVELSPLEKVGWERLEQPGGKMEMLRAVRLTRRDAWELEWFVQIEPAPCPAPGIAHFGPARIRFNGDLRRFEFQTARGWNDVRNDRYAGKALFVTLMLLQDLSPTPKPRPFPDQLLKCKIEGKPEIEVSVRLTTASACLVKFPETRTGWAYYHLQDPHTREPYFVFGEGFGNVTLRSELPSYSHLSAAGLRQLAARKYEMVHARGV